jgi:hypothetical protein
MRRPRADREEKRVTYGNGLRLEEQLDPNNPNQRRLLVEFRWLADRRASVLYAPSMLYPRPKKHFLSQSRSIAPCDRFRAIIILDIDPRTKINVLPG